jgi:hypothetical protein
MNENTQTYCDQNTAKPTKVINLRSKLYGKQNLKLILYTKPFQSDIALMRKTYNKMVAFKNRYRQLLEKNQRTRAKTANINFVFSLLKMWSMSQSIETQSHWLGHRKHDQAHKSLPCNKNIHFYKIYLDNIKHNNTKALSMVPSIQLLL